jgi:hydroxyacylglutathione hydrolase
MPTGSRRTRTIPLWGLRDALVESLVMNMLCIPVGPLQANCYLLWDADARACAVDPGGEPERLVGILQKQGLTLEVILVTHGHFDHIEGVAELSRVTGAVVYCSETVVPVLTGEDKCSATGLPVPAAGAEVICVTDGSVVPVGALTVRVVATPGHTPGDVTYEIEGALFCGDLLFSGSVGRTDFPGGDFGVLLASVARLTEMYPPETRVYPGHMEATSLGRELQQNPFLGGLRAGG